MRIRTAWLAAVLAGVTASVARAAQPYLSAETMTEQNLAASMSKVEQQLSAAGFSVVGRYVPHGLDGGVIVVTDPDLLAAVRAVGGTSIVAAPIRVGVRKNGQVSVSNPEYWVRAFAGEAYARVAPGAAAASQRLHRAVASAAPFGGDVSADDLPHYHYMLGMERFADRSLIREFPSFDQALNTVQSNLTKGVADTAQVYAVIDRERRLAVIGFAQNDPERGEGWWVNRIGGADHIAALPWEMFIVDGHAYCLYARYRTALAWPTLGMGQFMTIVRHPEATRRMAEAIAGAD